MCSGQVVLCNEMLRQDFDAKHFYDKYVIFSLLEDRCDLKLNLFIHIKCK